MGFLPMSTSGGERIFITVVVFIAIHFLWMAFLERFLTLWVATILAAVTAFCLIKWG